MVPGDTVKNPFAVPGFIPDADRLRPGTSRFPKVTCVAAGAFYYVV